ncbi:2TM domain-containing protein [Winogradskyella ursingii]|uniref:2TM domain-containing protein n=1 Tax=Winogradskyella ursingii TaxID=2686079 RepID=UPI0015CE5B13|nr:2TM domain-containing protein [Winogradskyella ursingii]
MNQQTMEERLSKKEHYFKIQKKLRRRRWFFIHLAGYIVVIALIGLNFYVLEDGPYTYSIISLNLSVVVAWTCAILIHGIIIFKSDKIFKKDWEEKKIKEYLKREEQSHTNLWK